MAARSPRLRWFWLGACLALAFSTPVFAQLQPRETPPASAPATTPPPASPANPAPENSPAGDSRSNLEPRESPAPALPVAPPSTAAPIVTAPNIADIVRAEIDRSQRERATEIQSSIKAAQRANEELVSRLGMMEESLQRQRERDSNYLRNFTRLSLTLAGGLTALAVIALGVIIWLQTRAARQQTEALAAQAQVLATLPQLLPGPHPAAHPTIASAQNRFHTAVDRVKQQLDEIESLAHTVSTPPSAAPAHDMALVPAASASTEPASHVENASPFALVPEPEPAPAQPGREDAATLVQKGHTLIQEGQPGPALAFLERATVLDPGNVHAWLKRGIALEKLQRLRDALLAYDTAAAIDPSLPVVHLSRAGVLNRLQRYDDALRCYEQALAVQGREGDTSAAVA